MKKDIHPKYEATTFRCSCGHQLETFSSIGGEKHLEICSQCHPFFKGDGKAKLVDTAGRIEKFNRRYRRS